MNVYRSPALRLSRVLENSISSISFSEDILVVPFFPASNWVVDILRRSDSRVLTDDESGLSHVRKTVYSSGELLESREIDLVAIIVITELIFRYVISIKELLV